MKLIFTILFCFTCLVFLFSQAPQKMSFQSVVRKSDNTLLTNSSVGVRISIILGSVNGVTIYSEIHKVNTNDNGLISLEIGSGIVTKGNFSQIDWKSTQSYLKTEFDVTGGTNFSITNVNQLLSVPYALYAEKSGSSQERYVGEFYGGGIIFHVTKNKNGEEHGLIMSINEISSGIEWSNVAGEMIGTNAMSLWNGESNTQAIINQPGHTNSAAKLCEIAVINGFDDWYLPSIDELHLLFNARYELNKSLETDNDPSTHPITQFDYYWSSSEAKSNSAWCKQFSLGENHTNGKNWTYAVRAVRKF